MSEAMSAPTERRVVTTSDGLQHCSAVRIPDGNTVAMDCPYTGKGEEFSPGNLVEAALGGCILLSMGTLAMRDELDLSGTEIEVRTTMTDKPRLRIGAIDVAVKMRPGLSRKDRLRLERAGDSCPIKHSFAGDVPVVVAYIYPD